MGISKRRVFGIVLKAGLLLALLAGGGLFLYLQSDSFQERVRAEIVAALEGKFPVRVELESARLHVWGARVTLKGLRIYDGLYHAEEPAVALDAAEVNYSITSFFEPAASLDAVVLDALRVRVVKDANDKLNLWNMFRNQDDTPPKLTALIRLAIKELTIRDGLIVFLDRSFHLESSKGGMEIEMAFDSAMPSYQGKLELTGLDVDIGGFRLQQVMADVPFTLFENTIEFPGIRIESRQVAGTASGALDDLGELVYHFETDFAAQPTQIANPPLDQLIDQGEARLSGAITGRKADFSFAGLLSSPSLVVRGLGFQNLDAKIRADSQGVQVEEAKFGFQGGAIQAKGALRLQEPDLSSFQLSGSGISLGPLVRMLDPGPLRISGRSRFQAGVQWPGLDFGKFKGNGSASFRGQLSFQSTSAGQQPPPQFPFEGQTRFGLNGMGVEVSDAKVAGLGGELLANGGVKFDSAYDLDVAFTAPNGSEPWSAALSSGLFDPEPVESLGVRVPGALRLDTNLAGEGRDYHLSGRLSAVDIRVRDADVGDLQTAFDLNPERVELEGVHIKGPVGEATGNLLYVFPVHPGANVDRATTGRLAKFDLVVPNADAKRLARIAGLDQQLEGRVSARVEGEEDLPGHFKGSGRVDVVNPVWNGVRVGAAGGRLQVSGRQLEVDDLRLTFDPAGLATGRLSVDLDSRQFDVKFSGNSVPMSTLDGFAEGKLEGIEGDVDFSLTASGATDAPRFQATAHSGSVHFGGQELTGVELKVSNDKPGFNQANFRLDAGLLGEKVSATGSLGMKEPYPIEASAGFTDFPLEPVLAQLPIQTDVALGGTASGDVSVTGNLSEPEGLDLEGVLSRLRLTMNDYEIENRSNVTLVLKGKRLRILPLTMVGKETELNLSGTVDLDGQRAINIKTSGQANLLLLNTFLPGGATFGQLNLETVVTGTLDSPKIVGQADLSKGFLRHPDVPTTIFDAVGKFRFTADQIAVDQFSARTTYGTINAEGGVFLAGLTPVRWLINVSGEGLRLEYPEKVVSTLDVDVDWINNEETQLLSGVVYVRSADYKEEITLPELILRYATTNALTNTAVSSQEVSLDIEVEGYRTLHIDNNLANVTASGDFKIRGTIANPVLLGSLTVDEGKLYLENNEYQVNRGTISFNDPRATRPVFNFEAETEVRDFSVSVILQGPLDQLNATFRSDPPLAASSIVSLLAVGQTQEEIFGTGGSQGQAGSLAIYGAGALLSKSLGKRLEAQTSRLFGFEKLSIDPFLYGSERDPGARVTLGKSLGKNVSVTYSTDLGNEGQGQIVVIEVKLTDWLTAVATGEQNGSVAIDFKLRKRF